METQNSLHCSLLKLVFSNSCRNYVKAKQILGFSGLVQFFLIFLLFFKYFVTYTFFLIRMSKFSLMLDVLISLENFRPKLQMLLLFVFLKFANFNFNTSVRHIPFLHIFLLLQIWYVSAQFLSFLFLLDLHKQLCWRQMELYRREHTWFF